MVVCRPDEIQRMSRSEGVALDKGQSCHNHCKARIFTTV